MGLRASGPCLLPDPLVFIGCLCYCSARVSRRCGGLGLGRPSQLSSASNLLPLLGVHSTEAEGDEWVVPSEEHPE